MQEVYRFLNLFVCVSHFHSCVSCLFSQWSRVFEESLALQLFLMESTVLIWPLVITSKLKAGHPVI